MQVYWQRGIFFPTMEDYLKHSWDPVLSPQQTWLWVTLVFVSFLPNLAILHCVNHWDILRINCECFWSIDFNLVADTSASRGSHFTQLHDQTRGRPGSMDPCLVTTSLYFVSRGCVTSTLALCNNKQWKKTVNWRLTILHKAFSWSICPLKPSLLFVTHLTVKLLTFVQIVYLLYVLKNHIVVILTNNLQTFSIIFM